VRKREIADTKKLLFVTYFLFSPVPEIRNAGACGWLIKVNQQGNADDFLRRKIARAMHHAHQTG
jgi:hypothetical protein